MGLIGRGPTTRDEIVVATAFQVVGWAVTAVALWGRDFMFAAVSAALLTHMAHQQALEMYGDRWPRTATRVVGVIEVGLLAVATVLLIGDIA